MTENAGQVTGAAQHVRDGGTVISTAYGVADELSNQSRITATTNSIDDKSARLVRVTEAVAAGQLFVPPG